MTARRMKYSICLFIVAIYVANTCGQDGPPPPPPPPSELNSFMYDSLYPLKRVARQEMPDPPGMDKMTPPPNMPEYQLQSLSRKRREARGVGGSMPTRKG